VIEPPRAWPPPRLRELWQYRDLVYLLGRRDIAIRYKQTLVGAAWAIAQPLAFAVVFSVFLTLIGRVPTDGVPYPVFALTGMSVWIFFGSCISQIAQSTVGSAPLITKVYFPRLAIPIAALAPPVVDFLAALVVLAGAMAVYGVAPGWNALLVPALFLLSAVTALGAGLWLSAVAVRYRDVHHIVPFAIQVGLFVSPVLYQLDLVPERFQTVYAINPLVGVLEGFRWALLGTEPPGALLLIPLVAGIALVVTGLFVFSRSEVRFADEL
jgi:lipopolysaccharide transport system permease protein